MKSMIWLSKEIDAIQDSLLTYGNKIAVNWPHTPVVNLQEVVALDTLIKQSVPEDAAVECSDHYLAQRASAAGFNEDTGLFHLIITAHMTCHHYITSEYVAFADTFAEHRDIMTEISCTLASCLIVHYLLDMPHLDRHSASILCNNFADLAKNVPTEHNEEFTAESLSAALDLAGLWYEETVITKH